jgi:putative serine protease PepD
MLGLVVASLAVGLSLAQPGSSRRQDVPRTTAPLVFGIYPGGAAGTVANARLHAVGLLPDTRVLSLTAWVCPTILRMRTRVALAAAAIALTGLTGCNDQGASTTTTDVAARGSATALQAQLVRVINKVGPSVVELQCGNALGSGIVFDDRGDVVTNAHVVGGAPSCTVRLSGGDTHPARVVGRDTGHDVAVVQLSGATPSPATFGDAANVRVGDVVLAMGNPLGLSSSVTQGIVSSLNRNVAESSNVNLSALIQTSAAINPGNSGGALVDLSGQVIGIPTLTATDPEFGGTPAAGIGFAIPSNVVRTVASSLIRSDSRVN